jgi:hypothetical protein
MGCKMWAGEVDDRGEGARAPLRYLFEVFAASARLAVGGGLVILLVAGQYIRRAQDEVREC